MAYNKHVLNNLIFIRVSFMLKSYNELSFFLIRKKSPFFIGPLSTFFFHYDSLLDENVRLGNEFYFIKKKKGGVFFNAT